MSDRDELVELVACYASVADTRDFEVLPWTVFTDPVTLDFESLRGRPCATMPLSDVLAGFKTSFASFTATNHAITNHRITIDGDRATIRAHVRAEHWLPSELVDRGPNCWLVVGFYDNDAVRTPGGWRLAKVKLSVTYQENAHLFDTALAANTDTSAT